MQLTRVRDSVKYRGARTKSYVSKRTARKHALASPPPPIIEHNCPISFSHYRSLCHHATVRIAEHVIVVITFARFADCHRRLVAIATIASRTIEIPSRARIRARTQEVFNKITAWVPLIIRIIHEFMFLSCRCPSNRYKKNVSRNTIISIPRNSPSLPS